MDSILLQKQVRDNAKDLQEFYKELKEWGDNMNKKDESLKRSTDCNKETPAPKNKVSKIAECKNTEIREEIKPNVKKGKKIKGTDYAAWEKFDADAYCAKLDKKDDEENSSAESELSDVIDETSLDLANSEKEKGNKFVKKQQWDQAIDCYTRAIECYAYDPIYYANRALCYLKKEMYRNAESDSTTALQLDKTYVKAYQRRAAARENLNQMSEAHSDLLKVLELEPKNKESMTVLARIEKKLENVKQSKSETAEEPRPVSKFTLSRQKHKDTTLEAKKVHTEKQPVALSNHVIERKEPTNANATSSKLSSEKSNSEKDVPSTSLGTTNKVKHNQHITPVSKLRDNTLLNKHMNNDIQLFQSIHKPLRSRSKKPLKRIQIIDVDLETEKDYLCRSKSNSGCDEIKTNDSIENTNVSRQPEIDNIKNNKFTQNEKGNSEEFIPKADLIQKSEMKETDKNEENLIDPTTAFELLNLPTPKTAVQFYNGWKSLKMKAWRKLYLLKITPNDLPLVFKESLESKIFSEIIETISDDICKNNNCLYDYLLALSQVKRFGALVMFMSSGDKRCMSSIIALLRQDNRYTNLDVDNLIKLYEL